MSQFDDNAEPAPGESILAQFAWNLFAALMWVLALGELTLTNLVVGFVLGYFAMWLGRDMFSANEYSNKVARSFAFAGFFLWELLLANIRVTYDVLTPRLRAKPAILAIPLDARTDLEITLLASFVSLTPDTLVLEVSADRSTMYVHAMYLDDPAEEKRRIKDGFERRILEITR